MRYTSSSQLLYHVKAACQYGMGKGYARKPGEPPGLCPREGLCANTEAHPPSVRRHSDLWDQPSQWAPTRAPLPTRNIEKRCVPCRGAGAFEPP